jgi:hypothetical protein
MHRLRTAKEKMRDMWAIKKEAGVGGLENARTKGEWLKGSGELRMRTAMQDGTNLRIVLHRLLHYRTNLLLTFCKHIALFSSVESWA